MDVLAVISDEADYGSGGVERGTEELLEQTATFLDAMRAAGSDARSE